jgi:hypothetical protein
MDYQQATDKLKKAVDTEDWGGLTTGMCEAFGISFESFLRFAQLNVAEQEKLMDKLYFVVTTQRFNGMKHIGIKKD